MAYDTLSGRLGSALRASGLAPTALATKAGVTEATVSNWLNDKVQAEHVKGAPLLRISAILGVRPEWLLLGEGPQASGSAVGDSQSQSVKHPTLIIALQLVAEALDTKDLTLPPQKRAELTALVYDLLEEGVPEAKVLRFARAAA